MRGKAVGKGIALLAMLASLGTLLVRTSAAGDWPQWRGPARDGVAPGVALPGKLPAQLQKLWEVEVGEGHSGHVVAGDKVVVLSRQGNDEVVQCLNLADGKTLWRDSYPAPYEPRGAARSHGKGPFSTPTIADGKVYAFGIRGVLTCYDLASGKVLWRKDYTKQLKSPYPMWGAANSPLVTGKMCILSVGSKGESAFVAFEKDTGNEIWKQQIDGAAYSSPVVAKLAGKERVVLLLEHNLVGVELATGKLLWKVPFVVRYQMNIITPVVEQDMVIVSGSRQPAIGVKVSTEGAKVVWKNEAESMFMSSPVLKDGYLYGLSDKGRGTLVCLDAATGKTKWSSPGGQGRYASLAFAGDKLLVLTTRGELVLVKASPDAYTELSRCRVTSRPVWSHIALTERNILVKDNSHLLCFKTPAQ